MIYVCLLSHTTIQLLFHHHLFSLLLAGVYASFLLAKASCQAVPSPKVRLMIRKTWTLPQAGQLGPTVSGKNEHFIKNHHFLMRVSWDPLWYTKNRQILKRVRWDHPWEYPIRAEHQRCEARHWEHLKMYPLELYPVSSTIPPARTFCPKGDFGLVLFKIPGATGRQHIYGSPDNCSVDIKVCLAIRLYKCLHITTSVDPMQLIFTKCKREQRKLTGIQRPGGQPWQHGCNSSGPQ